MTASHGCHRQSCSLSALTLSNARRSRPSSSLHVMRARSHGHGEMVTVHIKRYACHAAPCCKQLDRCTLSGPCFSILAISAHLTFSCVVCPALWPPVRSRRSKRNTGFCPCITRASFKERRKARARVVRQVGDRAASRHREVASVEYSTVWVALSA